MDHEDSEELRLALPFNETKLSSVLAPEQSCYSSLYFSTYLLTVKATCRIPKAISPFQDT